MANLVFATPAWAHVTVHPESLPVGSSDFELTFRVPNERDDADTVGFQVYFPSDLTLSSVDVLPVAGWTAKADTRTLATPIRTDDGPVDQVVSAISWTATTGGIVPGQYEDFVIAAGNGPLHPGSVVFKSLQTYSSGEVVRWIQVATPQDPRPDSPAPVLSITGPPAASRSVAPAPGGSAVAVALAVAALAVSLLALAATAVLVAHGRRRSTTASPDRSGPPA